MKSSPSLAPATSTPRATPSPTLSSATGANRLIGGDANDTLTGGSGPISSNSVGDDQITDFSVPSGDEVGIQWGFNYPSPKSAVISRSASPPWDGTAAGHQCEDFDEETADRSTLTPPAIQHSPALLTSATYDASSGVLAVTGANLTANSGADNDIDVSKLTLTGEGGNTYTLTSDDVELTSATAFSVTLNATDQLQLAGLLNKNGTSSGGGTTYNIAAALNWNPGASSSPADSTGNAVTVSNVAAPTLSSATYNDSTGVLALSGSNLPAYPGSSNDIDVSKLTITGGSGSTYTLTSGDVELTSATAASITLNSTDQSNLDSLLNKNGTASTQGTTYNIAAADDWAPGANSSTDIADLTGNAITVSAIKPTISVAINDGGDGRLNASEDGSVAIAGTTSGAEDGQTVAINISSSGGGTPINTTASVNSNVYSVTGLDLSSLNDGTLTITADVSDLAGNAATQATDTTSKDTAAPTISVAINDGGDGRLNASEDGSVAIAGTTSGAEDGQTVSINISSSAGGTPINTTATVNTNVYSLSNLDLSSLNDGTLTITADVDDLSRQCSNASHRYLQQRHSSSNNLCCHQRRR